MRWIPLLILTASLTAWRPAVVSNEPSTGVLVWSSSPKLDWVDFKGRANRNSNVDAVTSCGIMCDPTLESNGSLQFEVYCYFSKSDSWVKRDGKTANLLAHEQGHYDIGEIYARKLRMRLANAQFSLGRLDKQIQKLYDEVFEEYRMTQHNYDEESDHSRNERMQSAWEHWIQYQLHRYDDYSSSQIHNYSINR